LNLRGHKGSVLKDQISTNEKWVLIRFGLVGLSVNAIGYLFYLGLLVIGITYPLAMPVSYTLTLFTGYLLHGAVTFKVDPRRRGSAMKFLVVQGSGFLLNLLLLWFLVDFVKFGPSIAQAICIVVIAMANFFVYRIWVYQP